MNRAGIILAAGRGGRMKSVLPKVMHKVAGIPLLGHVIGAMRGAGVDPIIVVTAPEGDSVRAFAEEGGAQIVIADRQLGTGYSAACAGAALAGFPGLVVVSYGDQPLLTPENFAASFAAREKGGMSLVAFTPRDPAMYGRVVLDGEGFVERIVEFRDAGAAERAIGLCNAGIMAAEAGPFFRWAAALGNANAQGEYYLTDIPALARRDGVRCAVALAGETDVMGVNDPEELAAAEAQMQARLGQRAPGVWRARGT